MARLRLQRRLGHWLIALGHYLQYGEEMRRAGVGVWGQPLTGRVPKRRKPGGEMTC